MQRCILVLALLGGLGLTVTAADRHVVVVTGEKPIPVMVGDVVRVSDKVPAGGTVTATVDGPARLVNTNTADKIKEGKFLADAVAKEFEFLVEGEGKVTITVTLDGKKPDTKPTTKVYTVNAKTFGPPKDRNLVIVPDEKPVKAKVRDTIRVSVSRQAGPGSTTAKIDGKGFLLNTNTVTETSDRGPLVGAVITEFEVVASAKGKLTITCTMFNERLNTTQTKVFTIDVE